MPITSSNKKMIELTFNLYNIGRDLCIPYSTDKSKNPLTPKTIIHFSFILLSISIQAS
jgi:hypothetical protein